jgi:hypothetical protein
MKSCFQCDIVIKLKVQGLTDGVNDYYFCSDRCESNFIEDQGFDTEGNLLNLIL